MKLAYMSSLHNYFPCRGYANLSTCESNTNYHSSVVNRAYSPNLELYTHYM